MDRFIGGIGVHTRNNALKLRAHSEPAKSLLICSSNIFCSPRVFQPGVFRAYTRVVEASTDRMRFVDLPTRRLQEIRADTMHDTGMPGTEGGTVILGFNAYMKESGIVGA